MAVKYDRTLEDGYQHINRYMGPIQKCILTVFLKKDKDRKGMIFYNLAEEVSQLPHGRWYGTYPSMNRLFNNGYLCKIIEGEDIVLTTLLDKSKLRNRAWFLNDRRSSMEPLFAISPIYDIEILSWILSSKNLDLINKMNPVLKTAFEFEIK